MHKHHLGLVNSSSPSVNKKLGYEQEKGLCKKRNEKVTHCVKETYGNLIIGFVDYLSLERE